MNINQFDFADSPYEATLVYEMDSKSDLDKGALETILGGGDIFAPVQVEGKNVYFDISNKMSLKKYLGNMLTKGESLNLISSIVEAYGIVERAEIKRDNLLLDVDLVTVDYDTAEVSLVYLPVKSHSMKIKSLRAFLKEVFVNTIYDPEDDLEFVGQLISYVNTHRDMAADDLIDFIYSFAEGNGSDMNKAADFRAESYEEPEVYKTVSEANEPARKLSVIPYIVREKTGDRIEIDKDEFMVGKIAGIADLLLADNPTVSRMHAIIKKKNNTYYVCDNYSTNATFLNGEKLEPGKDHILLNGAKISFANEKCTFFER